MKILVAPLNWGLGHASRCVPLVQRFLNEGHEVILGGDGESLTLLRRHFPTLRYTYLAPLNLRYSAGKRQVGAMLKALPQLWAWSLKDRAMLKALLNEEKIDRVVSDNRFGLYNKSTECIYITHQLHILLPKGWHWAERLASRMHARIYARFNKVWVPDYADDKENLAGKLSHQDDVRRNDVRCTIEYIGPLSRFERAIDRDVEISNNFDIVVVLSGLEPQRTILEKEILARYQDTSERVLIVQGLMHRPNTRIKRANFTIVPSLTDAELVPALMGAKHIIARSGYSTIMDLHALGILDKAEFIPTPGQPEQEYLATLYDKMH